LRGDTRYLREHVDESAVVIGRPAECLQHAQPIRAQRVTAGGQLGTEYGNLVESIDRRAVTYRNDGAAHETVAIGRALVELAHERRLDLARDTADAARVLHEVLRELLLPVEVGGGRFDLRVQGQLDLVEQNTDVRIVPPFYFYEKWEFVVFEKKQ